MISAYRNLSKIQPFEGSLQALRAITRGTSTRFIINDNLSIAIESDADGIHLGQDDRSVTEARKTWDSPGKIFGLSTHSERQATLAMELVPDYIGIGPVFPTPTKTNADPTGAIHTLQKIRQECLFKLEPVPASL